MAIGCYFIYGLLVAILFMAYWWLFYLWLIGGYSINGLLVAILLIVVGGYFINGY
jgi:hypothetical protein